MINTDKVGDSSNKESEKNSDNHFVLVEKKKKKAKQSKVVIKPVEKEIKANEDDAKICAFYIQFRCKFGRTGKDCKFSHPKICINFMKNGSKGCDKNESCEFLHPDMCKTSLEGNKCASKRCFLGHIQGSRVVNSDIPPNSSKESSKNTQNFRKGSRRGHTPKLNVTSAEDIPFPPLPSQKAAQPSPVQAQPMTSLQQPLLPSPHPAMVTLLQSIQELSNQVASIQRTNQDLQTRYVRDRDLGRQDLANIWTTLKLQMPSLQPQSQPPIQGHQSPQVPLPLSQQAQLVTPYPQYSQIVQGAPLMGSYQLGQA